VLKFILFIVASSLTFTAMADDSAIAKLFEEHGLNGTIVISSIRNDKTIVYNEERAGTRFAPASSFKVFNTLIALEVGAIKDKSDTLKWDGTHYAFQDWNHDQTLESAYKVSCVWCYQQLARRVGIKEYRHYIDAAHYGILDQNFDLTNFWLNGNLTISAIEQISFLKKAYLHQLPFSAQTYATWKDVTLTEHTDQYKLYGKTGWAARLTPQIGWYIGYLETTNDVWAFAMNITLRKDEDLPLRQKITKSVFVTEGLMSKP